MSVITAQTWVLYLQAYREGNCIVCGTTPRPGSRARSCSPECWARLPGSEHLRVERVYEIINDPRWHGATSVRVDHRLEVMAITGGGVIFKGDLLGEMKAYPPSVPIRTVEIRGTITVDGALGSHSKPIEPVLTLEMAADRAYRFLAGLRLDDQPVAVQREALEVLRILGPPVNPDKAVR